MQKHQLRNLLIAASAAIVLTACGGGGDGGTPVVVVPPPAPTTGVPASALASTDGLLAYIKTLLGMNDETAQPVLIGDIALPTDETALPAPVN